MTQSSVNLGYAVNWFGIFAARLSDLLGVGLRAFNIVGDELKDVLNVVASESGLIDSAAGASVPANASHSAMMGIVFARMKSVSRMTIAFLKGGSAIASLSHRYMPAAVR